jgi:hypothetical protein
MPSDGRVHNIGYGFRGLVKKMSVLINILLQNTNLVSVLSILLVMSDRTDKFRELCDREAHMYIDSFFMSLRFFSSVMTFFS